MKKSDHLQNQANALINFGSQLSQTGLSYLELQAHQNKVNEADRVAKQKVLKEELTKAEIIGRQIAARNPNMSIMEEVIALKENVGLTIDNPNYQKVMEAMEEGFYLKRAEVGLASYNAEIKNNADNLGEEIYERYLEAKKPTVENAGPNPYIKEGFKGNLTQFSAEHLEDLRVATISNLVNSNDKENRFGTVLAKPGNRINYDPIKAVIAKKQNELDDQERYDSAFDEVEEDINQIITHGTTRIDFDQTSKNPKSSGKSLARIIQSLKDKGLSNTDTNRIVYTSLRSGLENEVLKQDINILNTNYFDNLISIIHDKTTDPKDGLSLYMKDKQAGNQLLEKINQKKKDLQARFDKQVNKTTKSKEEGLASDATASFTSLVTRALKEGNTKGDIRRIINEMYLKQGVGEDFEGIKFMDTGIKTNFITYLEKLFEEAPEDSPPVSSETIEKTLGKANGELSDIINKLSGTKLNQVNPRSTATQFNTALSELDTLLNSLQIIEDDVVEELKYGWEGESGWNTKIQNAMGKVREKKKDILRFQVEGSDLNSKEGIALKFESENTEYEESKVSYLTKSDPVITRLLLDAGKLTGSSEDLEEFEKMSEEFYTLLNQTLRKPNVNSTGLGIYYNTPFLYGEAERNKLDTQWQGILQRVTDQRNGKIIIDETRQRNFEVKLEKEMSNLIKNNEGASLDMLVKKIQGFKTRNEDAYNDGIIGQPTFTRIKNYLDTAITNKESIIDERYGRIKVFNDSTSSLRRYLVGETESGITNPLVTQNHRILYNEMETEHRALQDHLTDISKYFQPKKIKSPTNENEIISVPQADMFLSGTSIHNKRIREKAFRTHRNLMLNTITVEQVQQEISNMKSNPEKWSDEEVEIMEAVATFDSVAGRLKILQDGTKALKIGQGSSVSKKYNAAGRFSEGSEKEEIKPDTDQDLTPMLNLINTTITTDSSTQLNTRENLVNNISDMKTIEGGGDSLIPESTDNITKEQPIEVDSSLLGDVVTPTR
tara:strand:+ start:23031 stop:26042 length:3012 start_codon:yes stop_codon:yes gene_type:complete